MPAAAAKAKMAPCRFRVVAPSGRTQAPFQPLRALPLAGSPAVRLEEVELPGGETAARRSLADEDEVSSEESSPDGEAEGAELISVERRRARRRCTRHLTDALGDKGVGATFLERKSVEPATLAGYQRAWDRFEEFARVRGLRLDSDANVDDELV